MCKGSEKTRHLNRTALYAALTNPNMCLFLYLVFTSEFLRHENIFYDDGSPFIFCVLNSFAFLN